MLRSGTNSAFFFFIVSPGPGAVLSMVRCGACSHTLFIDRFRLSEGVDPLSLPFTSKTGQSHSVAQKNRQTVLFIYLFFFFLCFTLLGSKEMTYFDIL